MASKKVLVIGDGGREHALIWKIKQSPLLEEIYTSNKNFGKFATYIDIGTNYTLTLPCICKARGIEIVIVGQEKYLVDGIADTLSAEDIKVFGPSRNGAKLEGSKSFTKELCDIHEIPTAAYGFFTNSDAAKSYVKKIGLPVVIKANGLAAGKGVFICHSFHEANSIVDAMFEGNNGQGLFGEASKSIVIEEFLEGEEISYFVLLDGTTVLPLGCARDYKKIEYNGKMYNTGGMGAYSPVNLDPETEKKILGEIIYPTVTAMSEIGVIYKGVLFAGIMLTKSGPKLLEYNVRLGDPEAQVLLTRLKSDFLDLIIKTVEGKLNRAKVEFNDEAALCIVLASNGYPIGYSTGFMIKNVEDAVKSVDGVNIFNASIRYDEKGNMFSMGGRVLSIVATGKDLVECRERAYKAAEIIDWKDGFYLPNIGKEE